jgi:large subunit ribosomal protein L25
MEKISLVAEKRTISGRKVKALRQKGIIPANVFGKKIKSFALQVSEKDFERVFKDAGETGIVELSVKNGKTTQYSVLISNVQKNPVTDSLLHIDFRQVDLKEKIEAAVPIEFTGESPAEKTGVGTVVQYVNEVSVEALPTDLPEKFEVDASTLSEVDQAVLLKDLKYDKAKVSIKDDLEKIVAKVEPPQKIEEVAPAPEEAVEGEEGAEVPTGAEEAAPEGESQPPAGEEEKTPQT